MAIPAAIAADPLFGCKRFALVDGWIAAKRPAELHVVAGRPCLRHECDQDLK